MNYSRRALYAVGEPFGEGATRREVGGRIVYGSGGGKGQTSTQNTSNVPLFAEDSFKDMLGRAEALSQSTYTPYQGERTAGFNPMQQQAQQNAAGQQTAPQLGTASGIAGAASMQALNAGQFQPGTFTPMGVQAPQLSNFQMNAPERVGISSFTQPGTAQQFMNPYMQNVVNIQTREAQRNADIAGTQRGADAVRAGGFGGSRQAIMDAEAQRNLSQQLGDIQATGSQAAFQQAQNQFNTEQGASLQAQQANQGAGLSAGQANLQAALGTQSLGAQTGMQAQQSNQQALLDAQRAFEQSRQFGQQQGLQGAQTALQGANTLGQLGQQQFGQQLDITQQQNVLGGQQQALEQRNLDQQFGDFQTQQERPFQNVGFLSDILRGSGSTTRTVNPGPSALSQVAGAGVAAAGFLNAEGGTVSARGYAEGGEIEGARYAGGFAAGGITEPLALPDRLRTLSDQQLSQFAQQNKEDLFSMALAKSETDARARMRQMGVPTQTPQGTVMDEVSAELAPQMPQQMPQQMDPMAGGIAAGAPDIDFADGGIVGFAPGGEVLEKQRQADREGVRRFGRNVYEQMKNAGAAITDIGTLPLRGLTGAYDSAVVRPMRAAGVNASYLSPMLVPDGADPNSMTPFFDQTRDGAVETQAQQVNYGNEGRRTPSALPNTDFASGPRPTPMPGSPLDMGALRGDMPSPFGPSGAMPGVGTGLAAAAGVARPGVAPSAAPGIQTAAGLMAQSRELSGADAAEAKMLSDQQEINALDAKGSAQDRADFEAEVAQRSLLGAEREKRLKTQEDRAEAGDKKSFNMALVEAGLAIMGGQSPNTLTNIAEGAKAGVRGFQARLDKYETEKQRFDDARDRIDELRRAEGMAAGKEKRLLGREIRATETAGKIALAKINVDIFGATQKQADAATNAVFDAEEKARAAALQQASTERTAQIYRPPGSGGDARSALTLSKEEARILLARQTSIQRDLNGALKSPYLEKDKQRKALLIGELDEIRSLLRSGAGQTPAVESSVTRLRFDAQGNPIQ